MITIAIATHKGGTGKTVTAMALAAAFAGTRSTVLVDLDPQGHSTRGLGVDVGDRPTLRDLLVEPARPIEDVVVAHPMIGRYGTPTYNHARGDSPLTPCAICQREAARRPLFILPADIRAERDARALYMRPRREQVLARALARLEPAPDLVVIDCPPSLGALTENGIAAADWIVAPCQMEARTTDAIADLLELTSVLKDRDGAPPFDAWRLVYTRYDARKAVTNRAIEGALEPYADHTLSTRIPQNEALNQAQIEQVDIFTYAPASKGAIAYADLARELLGLITPAEAAA